jgi:diketogulonate reductase-like aldo/keto reductase
MLVGMNGDARVLADGNKAPMLALGVWQVRDGPECVNAVRWALEAGYRARIHENAQIFGFDLSAEDMAELDALDQTGGTDGAQEYKWW